MIIIIIIIIITSLLLNYFLVFINNSNNMGDPDALWSRRLQAAIITPEPNSALLNVLSGMLAGIPHI